MESCSERLENFAEVAQLVNEHVGVGMPVCLAPKVYGFSVATATYTRREEFQKGRETRRHTFHTVRVPRSHPSWWKKARGGGFARTAKENLGSILRWSSISALGYLQHGHQGGKKMSSLSTT